MAKKSKIEAILQCKCPQCREGDLFVSSPLNAKFAQMYTNCPNCGLFYEPEPGFFQGAMYVSYAFSVALFIVCGFTTFFVFNDPEPWVYLLTVVPLVLITLPFNFRYSRSLFIHFVGGVSYKPELSNKNINNQPMDLGKG